MLYHPRNHRLQLLSLMMIMMVQTTGGIANNSQPNTPIMVSEKLLLFYSSGINSLLLVCSIQSMSSPLACLSSKEKTRQHCFLRQAI